MNDRKGPVGAGAARVRAFDSQRRSWVMDSGAGDPIPDLEGSIVCEPGALAEYANDAGGSVHNAPSAVLRPGSVRDIQETMRFASRHRIDVAPRGQGHTTFGQSQVKGGLVIDMRPLSKMHSIETSGANVEAGATWSSLVAAAAGRGLTPPVLTGYLGLSIGGTLSVGGVPQTYNQGTQVDRVQELDVVTGHGELRCCSMRRNRELFEAALAGLGQCGIITRAVVDLVPAPEMARMMLLNYVQNGPFFDDFRALLDRDEFDKLNMFGLPNGSGGWVQQLCAVKFFDPGSTPDNGQLLRDLRIDPSTVQVVDMPYLANVQAVDVLINQLQDAGQWKDVLHPWFDVWLPESDVESYVGETLAHLPNDDVGTAGFLLLFAQRRSKLTRPLLRTPATGKYVYLFDILTAAAHPGGNPEFEMRMLSRNRALYQRARELGGTRYPIGSIPFDHVDWEREYGDTYSRFAALKKEFDPAGILTPGPGIFRRTAS